jgi:CDP-diglyceride synthetase
MEVNSASALYRPARVRYSHSPTKVAIVRMAFLYGLFFSGSAHANIDHLGLYAFPVMGSIGGLIAGIAVALLKESEVGFAKAYISFLLTLCLLASVASQSADIFFWFLVFGGSACAPTFAAMFFFSRHFARRTQDKTTKTPADTKP